MNSDAVNLIANELLRRGVSPAAASGAIAGIMGESGADLSPTAFNSKDPHGGAGGIVQWNGDRLIGPNGMLAFAKANGVNVDVNTPTDSKRVPLAIQAKFLGHELDTSYSHVLKGLQVAQNGETALNTWVNNYEMPADKVGAINQRSQYVNQVAKLIGAPITPGFGTTAAGGAGAPVAVAQTPTQREGSSIGAALGALGGSESRGGVIGGGYGSGIQDPPDAPAIRTMAAESDFMPGAANPVPQQFAGGAGSSPLGSQLGALAVQPSALGPAGAGEANIAQGEASITQGAPSMTGMVGQIGGQGANVYDPRAPMRINPNQRFSRLG